MERTLYFNYTKPSQTQLNYTEDTRSRGILRRQRSSHQMGIRTGFRVSVNTLNDTKIDVGPGEGYTGGFFLQKNLREVNGGERISTLTPGVTVLAQALADYTLNAKNYVSLVYVETTNTPKPEKYYPYTAHNTIVEETFSVEVLVEADWLALTNDELEQRVLIAIVTANGAGVPLTSASINQVIQPKSHPIAVQPVSITGVIITSIYDSTTIGTGQLRFETATKSIYWTAPGDAEGPAVVITSSGYYTLYSDTAAYYIVISVIFSSLPALDTSEDVTIRSLYGREIPLHCAIDQVHRDMVGTGQTSLTNPHGLSINDLSGGTFEHADLFHIPGISSHANATQLACSANTFTDRVEIINLGSADNSFLIDGITYQNVAGFSTGATAYVQFSPAVQTDGEYLIYLDSAGAPQYVQLSNALWRSWFGGGIIGTVTLVDMHSLGTGLCKIRWNQTNKTLEFWGVDGAYGTPVQITQDIDGATDEKGYYKLYSDNTNNWIIIYVSGDLDAIGINEENTFNTSISTITHPDQSILKLYSVGWDNATQHFWQTANRDLRRFVTADNRNQVDEEHDTSGSHTKVLRNTLRVARDNDGIFSSVATAKALEANAASMAVYGVAGNTALYGIATTDTGVYGNAAQSVGVVGSAGVKYGVVGLAANIGIYGGADVNTGAMGSAVDTGVYGLANNTAGVVGSAVVDTGVYGKATSNTGVMGNAALNTGIYGKAVASDYGVYGSAGRDYGVFGYAANKTGVMGSVAVDTGVYGLANNTAGVVGSAVVNTGVYGKCFNANDVYAGDVYGVFGTATATNASNAIGIRGEAVQAKSPISAIGVVGYAESGTGVAGSASNTGVYGKANVSYGVFGSALSIGVYGKVTDHTGVLGAAAGNTGVYGLADNYGVYGKASVNTGVMGSAVDTGVYGEAVGNTGVMGSAAATGVYGKAAGNTGVMGSAAATGVYGEVTGNTGVMGSAALNTGIYGEAVASDYGVYGSAGRDYGVFGYAVNKTGVMGSAAVSYGVYGKADTWGVYGYGLSKIGIEGTAPTIGVYGHVANHTGVYGLAAGTIGVLGSAPSYGVSGLADTYGVIGYGASSIGVYGSAPTTAIYGKVVNDIGVFGSAAGNTGVIGSAINIGVYGLVAGDTGVLGSAVNTGVMGRAGATGVYGLVTGNTGVMGSAVYRGIYGVANSDTGAYGSAARNTGIYGIAAGYMGVCGSAVGNTGVYGEAATYGVYGYAITDVGVLGYGGRSIGVYGGAAVDTGVYGTAPNTGVKGVAQGGMGVCGYAIGGDNGVYGEATAGQFGVQGVAATIGVWGDGATDGDLGCQHGIDVPAISFFQATAGAPGGTVDKHVYVKYGATTYALALYKTA